LHQTAQSHPTRAKILAKLSGYRFFNRFIAWIANSQDCEVMSRTIVNGMDLEKVEAFRKSLEHRADPGSS
jgi:hypothetical protein